MSTTQSIINFFINNIKKHNLYKYKELNKIYTSNEIYYKTFIKEYIKEHLYSDLTNKLKNDYSKNEIMQFITEWQQVYNEVITNNEQSYSTRENRNDKTFKKAVRDRANNKCQVSNYTDLLGNFDVAHIFEFAECNNEYEKYDVNNGLLLRTDIHRAWDNNSLIIEYDKTTRTIYFKMNNQQFKLSETYLAYYETEYNIIHINTDDQYFEEYCKYIDLRNE
jgi:hypothetical protein